MEDRLRSIRGVIGPRYSFEAPFGGLAERRDIIRSWVKLVGTDCNIRRLPLMPLLREQEPFLDHGGGGCLHGASWTFSVKGTVNIFGDNQKKNKIPKGNSIISMLLKFKQRFNCVLSPLIHATRRPSPEPVQSHEEISSFIIYDSHWILVLFYALAIPFTNLSHIYAAKAAQSSKKPLRSTQHHHEEDSASESFRTKEIMKRCHKGNSKTIRNHCKRPLGKEKVMSSKTMRRRCRRPSRKEKARRNVHAV